MLIRPQVSYPGVYVVEVPSTSHTVPDIPTSVTAFVGRTLMGPVNEPLEVGSMADFQQLFGGLWESSPLSYAVNDFFLNGGSQAIIVRIFGSQTTVNAITAAIPKGGNPYVPSPINTANVPPIPKKPEDPVPTGAAMLPMGLDNTPKLRTTALKWSDPLPGAKTTKTPTLMLLASSPGEWGNYLSASLDRLGITDAVAAAAKVDKADLFNLTVYWKPPSGEVRTERITKATVVQSAGKFRLDRVLKAQSMLISVDPTTLPKADAMSKLLDGWDAVTGASSLWLTMAYPEAAGAHDGYYLDNANFYTSSEFQNEHEGLYALDKVDIFNLLCIPRDNWGIEASVTFPDVFNYVKEKRAFWILDAPVTAWDTPIKSGGDLDTLIVQQYENPGELGRNAAVFYPDVYKADSLNGGELRTFGPCGVVAGVFARTDQERGVWKAPAGTAATMVGVLNPKVKLNDDKNGRANLVGINCIRTFRDTGSVVWGSRTLQGAEALDDAFKYIPVRRLSNYIEESLYRAMQWAVFEPNHEPLWSAIRLQIGNFMTGLMKQGAFQGFTQKEAFFVKCDSSTTTPDDITRGICNVVVGFAPVKPAEFVVLYFEQMTADTA